MYKWMLNLQKMLSRDLLLLHFLGIALKSHQEEAIIEFVSGKDVFVALPTGRIW